jgi:hypothetical protein
VPAERAELSSPKPNALSALRSLGDARMPQRVRLDV